MKANRQGAVSFFISVQMMSDNGQYFYSESAENRYLQGFPDWHRH